jgi:hypothetical protein
MYQATARPEGFYKPLGLARFRLIFIAATGNAAMAL